MIVGLPTQQSEQVCSLQGIDLSDTVPYLQASGTCTRLSLPPWDSSNLSPPHGSPSSHNGTHLHPRQPHLSLSDRRIAIFGGVLSDDSPLKHGTQTESSPLEVLSTVVFGSYGP
jgi:hypothetical protein